MSATDFGDPRHIIHIPARDLTGTREAKLAELETFLAQLQVVRLALSGPAARLDGFAGAASPPPANRHHVDWTWPARRLRTVLNDFRANAERARGSRWQ